MGRLLALLTREWRADWSRGESCGTEDVLLQTRDSDHIPRRGRVNQLQITTHQQENVANRRHTHVLS